MKELQLERGVSCTKKLLLFMIVYPFVQAKQRLYAQCESPGEKKKEKSDCNLGSAS